MVYITYNVSSKILFTCYLFYHYWCIVSNVNAKRLSQGKGPVGFLNPTLYANANVFQDITLGNNRCPQNQECCKSGFYATTGWDPVTGMQYC